MPVFRDRSGARGSSVFRAESGRQPSAGRGSVDGVQVFARGVHAAVQPFLASARRRTGTDRRLSGGCRAVLSSNQGRYERIGSANRSGVEEEMTLGQFAMQFPYPSFPRSARERTARRSASSLETNGAYQRRTERPKQTFPQERGNENARAGAH